MTKVTLVTAAGSGLGEACARELSAAGLKVGGRRRPERVNRPTRSLAKLVELFDADGG